MLLEPLEARRLLSVDGIVRHQFIDFIGDSDSEFYRTGPTAEIATLSVADTRKGDFVPTATLKKVNPGGSLEIVGHVSAREKKLFSLDAGTTYGVEMHDNSYRETGEWFFAMEGINPPSLDSQPIDHIGETVEAGTIEAGEIDEYTFTANSGDVVTLSLADTDHGDYHPRVELYAPSGAKVTLYSTLIPPSSVDPRAGKKAVSRALLETGKYVIQVFDDNYRHTGDYRLALERLQPPGADDARVKLGDVVHGVIVPGSVDEFYFLGQAGSRVTISLSEAEAGTDTELWAELYSPSGVKVGGAGRDDVENGHKVVYQLPAETGTYVVQVFDGDYTHSERYGLAVEGLNPISDDAPLIARNVSLPGLIDSMGKVDEYYFTLPSSLRVTVELTADDTVPYKPRVALYNSATGEFFGDDNRSVTATLAAGTYVIQVFDNDYTHTGAYQVKWNAPAVMPTVDFAPASQTISEGATASFSVQLSTATLGPVSVPFTLSGTATEGTDYLITPNPALIPAGSVSAMVTITALGDAQFERNEAAIVTMGTPVGANPGTSTVHTATILNTPPRPTVSFTSPSQRVSEAADTLTITVQLSALASEPVTVPYTLGGTARQGEDYTITSNAVVIPAGGLTGTITVSVINDTTSEGDETIRITMAPPIGSDWGATTVHTATIEDNDACVSFAVESSIVGESAGTAAIVVRLSSAANTDVSVPFTVSGTATQGMDYTIAPNPVVIPAGSRTGTITLTPIDDTFSDPNETVIVSLDTPTGAPLCAPAIHTLTMDDEPSVWFTAASQGVSEAPGKATITVQLSSAASTDVSVPFTVSGTAAQGEDYTISPNPVVIPAGLLTGTITVTVIGNAASEPEETIIVTMGAPTGADRGDTVVHTVTIVDVSCASFRGDPYQYQHRREDEGFAVVTVQQPVTSASDVAVPFTVSGPAEQGKDYTITPSPLIIPAGSRTAQIVVALIDDTIAEAREFVELQLKNSTGCPSALYNLHIVNHDPTVEFTAATQTRPENAKAMTIAAELSWAAYEPVQVELAVGGTATQGAKADYTITPNPLIIPAGSWTGSITVTLNNDKIAELDETVTVTMVNSQNASLGSVTQHTATIVDDEPLPKVSFTATKQSLTENATALTVTARLSAVPVRPVALPFALSGSAVPGVDYVVTASPLMIPAGVRDGTITVTIHEDVMDEAEETLSVTLGTPTNAVLGSKKSHAVTIRDDDPNPTVSFTTASQSIGEDVRSVTITARLSEVSGQQVVVPLKLSGTARNGATQDYTIAPSTLVIPAGSPSATITVTVNDDVQVESDETIVVTLRKPVRATLGALAQHLVTIRDNDGLAAASEYYPVPTTSAQRAARPATALASRQRATLAGAAASPDPASGPDVPDFAADADPFARELESLLDEIASVRAQWPG